MQNSAPEVELVCNQLRALVQGKKIYKTKIYAKHWPPVIKHLEENCTENIVRAVQRHGNTVVILFSNLSLVINMVSGVLTAREKREPHRTHDKFSLVFDKFKIVYGSAEKRDRLSIVTGKKHVIIASGLSVFPGLDVLDNDLNHKKPSALYLWDKYLFKEKSFLESTAILYGLSARSKGLAGLNSPYIDEILFACNLHPALPIGDITLAEKRNLIKWTWKILENSKKYGGLNQDLEGYAGEYRKYLAVHNREGKTCKVCDKKIVKDTIQNYTVYYCPYCQKQ